MDSLLTSTRPIKKKIAQMPLTLFHKIERERMLPNSFYKSSITLMPKSNRDTHTHTEKEEIISQSY
jgi:hypothetical protein